MRASLVLKLSLLRLPVPADSPNAPCHSLLQNVFTASVLTMTEKNKMKIIKKKQKKKTNKKHRWLKRERKSFVSVWPNMWNNSVFRLHSCTLVNVCVCVAALCMSMNASWKSLHRTFTFEWKRSCLTLEITSYGPVHTWQTVFFGWGWQIQYQ